jgi:hypothetical protein
MYRLEGGSYRQAPVADEYRSAVFNTRVRIMPDAREREEAQQGVPEEDRSPPRFQWWDPAVERCRDRENDLKLAVKLAGIQEGQVRILIQALDAFLPDLNDADCERLVAAWSTDGIPDDMLSRIMEAGRTPDEWESILDVL